MEGVMMAMYFKTLEQAEQHIDDKKSRGHSKIDWCIVDGGIGFLVLSKAQAHHCFPDLLQGDYISLTKTT
jgi:hypothetical protein